MTTVETVAEKSAQDTRPERSPLQEDKALAPQGKAAGLQTIETGDFANLLDTRKFEHMWRVASLYAKSKMVPEHYRGSPEDVFVAAQMAVRLGVDIFMFLQNTYVIHGKPGMEAKLAIALVNSRGPFDGPIQWKFEGDGEKRKCTAFARHRRTGEICEATVSWDMVKKEGWADKPGSKWKSIPDVMFRYRAATFLARLYAPECLMGMQTVDELDDTPRRFVDAQVLPSGESKASRLADRLGSSAETPAPTTIAEAQHAAAEESQLPKEELSGVEAIAARWRELCEIQAEKHGMTYQDAESRLSDFVSKLFRVIPRDMTRKQFDDLTVKVKAGDIKPLKD
jgi:ribosomal protein S18